MVSDPRFPRIENRISLGNVLTVFSLAAAGFIAWGASQGDIRALAQRVEAGEKRDDETARDLSAIKGSVIRIETEQKAVRDEAARVSRQLETIEQLLRQQTNNRGRP